jgi:outer membrane protein assembly factor BamA
MRRLSLALLLILCAFRAAAEEPARFFIERIDVRGMRHVSRDVIVAESRLHESQSYGESELREAAARVTRAPYLLSADFALEKGSERGKYVLVINVNETKPFFFRLDLVPIDPTSPNAHREINAVTFATDNDLALGFRYFVGRRGEIHAGIEVSGDNRPNTADYGAYVAGYTQYDILGTGGFLTLNAKKPQDIIGQTARIEPQIVAGLALSINQTLTVEYDPTDVEYRKYRTAQRIATVRWSLNTTNHPLLPTRGIYLTVAPIAIWHDNSGVEILPGGKSESNYVSHDQSLGLEASANRWWDFSGQNSVGAGIAGGVSRYRESGLRPNSGLDGVRTGTANFGTLSFSAAHSFFSAERVAREGDSRLQIDAKLATQHDSRGIPPLNGGAKQLSASWVRRTSWGFLRLGYGYAW